MGAEVPSIVSMLPEDEWRLNGPLHQERQLKIICIGAGASGLLFAYKVQRNFDKVDMILYEKNEALGGTWLENRYPGCACDVPAHNYTFSFEPNPDWSAVYAGSGEIFDYFQTFAKKYELQKYIQFSKQVVRATWNVEAGGYNVKIQDLSNGNIIEDYCHILINAGGILNAWKWPQIPGLEKFKGKLLHTAAWDPSILVSNKVVGLIGNGSSGIQVLPAIQPEVKQLVTFVREPTYVSPVQGLGQREFSVQEKDEFANVPGQLLEYRRQVEQGMNDLFPSMVLGSQGQAMMREHMVQQMRSKLQDPCLEEKLIPDWSVGCRRITPGINYLESLKKENVLVVYGEISEITQKGCLVNDVEHPVDILICATGFDTSFRPRFALYGPAGENLQDVWATYPHSYLGVAAAGFPNYFMFLGPNCPIGNGPCLMAIEAEADWMMQVIDRYQTHNIYSLAPRQDAVNDFIAFKDQFMRKTVWSDSCRSWYKANQADAPVIALWPGSSLHYFEVLQEVRWEDFDVQYTGNRFTWLGNGLTQSDLDKTCDTAFYIREEDDGQYFSRKKQIAQKTKPGTMVRTMTAAGLRGE